MSSRYEREFEFCQDRLEGVLGRFSGMDIILLMRHDRI
jgi:hypothetical protein